MMKISMKKQLAVTVATIVLSQVACADDTWMVRLRGIEVAVDNGNSPVGGLGLVKAENKFIPEVDISYFFNKNLAAELILTNPQASNITLGGGYIGSLKYLPPVLSLQYHFLPEKDFQPYVGVGLNYTSFSNVGLRAGATVITVDSSSTGLAGQVGFDYRVDKQWYFNADAKYVDIKTNIYAGGAFYTKLSVNPWLFGVGVGYRF